MKNEQSSVKKGRYTFYGDLKIIALYLNLLLSIE